MFCFAKLCRICLREDRPLINMYCVNEDNVRLCEILLAVKPDMNTINTALPAWICTTCKKQLHRAYEFQKKCSKSLQIFIHYLSLLKCDNDGNEEQNILSVQMVDILHHNDEDEAEKCAEESFTIKSENSNSCADNFDSSGAMRQDEIFSRKTDSRCHIPSFSDFTSDFICDVKNKFKLDRDSDAESESTVILNVNNVVDRVDELNNKENCLTGTSELDTMQNVLANLRSEQPNSELCKSSNNTSNVLTNNQLDNSTDIFRSEFTKKVARCDITKSSVELKFRSNIHFNTISFNNPNNSESSLNSVNIKRENSKPTKVPTEGTMKNLNSQLTTEDEPSTSSQIKIENEESSALPAEDQLVQTFCGTIPTANSSELNEEQKFTFELDFTQDDKFNLNTEMHSDIKSENVSMHDFDGSKSNSYNFDSIDNIMNIEKTELLPEKKEDIVPEDIINTDDHMQPLYSENNVNCSNYENVQDILTIEKAELPPLEPEEHTNSTTELTENISSINNFKHIRVKTTDTINNTIMSQPSIETSSHSKSILINQLSNGNVVLNNSHLTSKTALTFSISNLVKHSTDLQEQNKRLLNHASNTLALKRRKMDLSRNENTIFNYNTENAILANTEIAKKTNSTYIGPIYVSKTSEYIDMDEYMRNGLNSAQNFIQTPAVFQNHASNTSYSQQQPSSLGINETNYFVGNTNLAHSLEMNHKSYTNKNIQSTVSNQTINSRTSDNTTSNYNGRSHISPYQVPINPLARKDYEFHSLTVSDLTNSTLHQNISQTGVSNNEKPFPIDLVEKNLSYNGRQQIIDANKDSNTRLTVKPFQISTTIVPEVPKEFTNGQINRLEQHSEQKHLMDDEIDNRPHSRSSPVSVSSSNGSSSNSNTEGSTGPTTNNHFFSFFSNLKAASDCLRTTVEGFVENEDEQLLFTVDVNKSVYTCKKCDEHFPCISELCIHGEMHTEEFDYQTMIYRTRDHTAQSDSIDFVITHDIKLFLCKKCDMHFPDKSLLLVHIKRHVPNMVVTDANPLVCECSNCAAFNLQSDGTDFKCSKCDKTFPNAENLRIHEFVHLLDRPAKCVTCNRTYKNKKLLWNHNDTVHAAKVFVECPVCKKQIISQKFKYHQQMHGTANTECDICGKKYKGMIRLHIHKRIHSVKKPFGCKYCDKKFLLKTTCENHERTHTGEKPYECKVCKKCFSQQTSLQVHMRVHTGEKPYKCKDCGKSYTQSYVYKQHLKKHHPPSSP